MNVIRIELVRLLEWKRWGVVALVISTAGIVTAYSLAKNAHESGIGINQWDVPLFALNHPIIVPWLLVPAFVGLVGDIVLRDRWTRFAMLTLPRIGSRSRWWASKLGAVFIAGYIYYLGVVVLLSLVALPFTDVGWSLSAYGRSPAQILNQTPVLIKGYDIPPFPTAPLVSLLLIAMYGATATSALATPILAVAQAWPRAWVPFALTFAVVAAFFVITPTNGLHPLTHLFWDYHNFGIRGYAVEWWMSVVLIVAETTSGLIIGTFILRSAEI